MRIADAARQVKIGLANPRKLAGMLDLVDKSSEKQATGIIVRCPSHNDRGRANCSITTGTDGTVRVKCHACDFKGDALTLIACVYGLDEKQDFRRILITGAELAGNHALVAELEDGKPRPDRIHLPEPRQLPEPKWPEGVAQFWDSCPLLTTDEQACALLARRGLPPYRVESGGLARVLPSGKLPKWAKYGKRTWTQTSNRIVVRCFDACGTLRSVRAWRVVEGDSPKRLPPSGCRSAGLVLADRLGWLLLSGRAMPRVLWIVEGEPDWMAASIAAPGGHAVWGIGSGSWNADLAKACSGVRVVMVGTHPDEAGDRYAKLVTDSVKRATRWRPPSDLDETGAELQGLMGAATKWCRVPHVLGE